MEKEYVANGERVVLQADPCAVAVRFRQAVHSLCAWSGECRDLDRPCEGRPLPNEEYTILPVCQADGPRDLRSVLAELDASAYVARAAPVFRVGPNRAVATDRVLVGFHPGAAAPDGLFRRRGYEVVSHAADAEGDEYLVRLGEGDDPFTVSAELAARDEVAYAEPDFVIVGENLARTPASPAGERPARGHGHYARRLTRADEALALQPGLRDVRIAILDDGVDTRHADLAPALAACYDATDDDEVQDPLPTDSHGTACAGLAAALCRGGEGAVGVAAGCSLLAVRIAFSREGCWVTDTAWIARGVDWAWRQGDAAVLSLSWGNALPSSHVARAFARARTRGRGGRGCVVVAAAGNSDAAVGFPATLPGVLAVAASNQFDEPKTPTSADDETWWGSCFGPEVALAAPGVLHHTTDLPGSAGFNPAPSPEGDYLTDFNGTSAAAPMVAGAAALVLSANPALTEAEVRDILCATADKVGSEPYVDGRNDRMGFGRLNVLEAVREALRRDGGGFSRAA